VIPSDLPLHQMALGRFKQETLMQQVSMYTLSTCPSCKKTKKFFDQHHIPFESINYDLADQPTQERIMRELDAADANAFPFVRIGDQVVEGYQPGRYAELLGIPNGAESRRKASRGLAF
jgi:glutaredoxin